MRREIAAVDSRFKNKGDAGTVLTDMLPEITGIVDHRYTLSLVFGCSGKKCCTENKEHHHNGQ